MVATLAGLELDLNKLSKQVREYVAMCGSQRGKSAQELREMKDLVSLRQKLSKVTRFTRSLHPSVVTLCAVKFVQTVRESSIFRWRIGSPSIKSMFATRDR